MTDEEIAKLLYPNITELKERPQQDKFKGGDEWENEDIER